MVENFDEWLAIWQSFPYKPLSLNVSPLKPTINLSRQTFENDSCIKVFSSNICAIRYILLLLAQPVNPDHILNY